MPAVPWHIIAKMGIRTTTENTAHPIRQISMPNVDLRFRTLRSHLQNTLGFFQAARQTSAIRSDDGFHVVSYGAKVENLVREILDMK